MAKLSNGDKFPELEPHCGSWVRSTEDGIAISEIFDRNLAESRFNNGDIIETAAQYLGRINRGNNSSQKS